MIEDRMLRALLLLLLLFFRHAGDGVLWNIDMWLLY